MIEDMHFEYAVDGTVSMSGQWPVDAVFSSMLLHSGWSPLSVTGRRVTITVTNGQAIYLMDHDPPLTADPHELIGVPAHLIVRTRTVDGRSHQ